MKRYSLSQQQKVAYEQQTYHLARAHTQALKRIIESKQSNKPTLTDALAYLERAKWKLSEEEFNELTSLMKQCGQPSLDIATFFVKLSELLNGYPELLQGFGMFLPSHFNLQLQTHGMTLPTPLKTDWDLSEKSKSKEITAEPSTSKIMMEEAGLSHHAKESELPVKKISDTRKEIDGVYAVTFLSKVKERFQEEPQIYDRFIDLLESVRKNTVDVRNDIEADVYLEVCELFQNQDDLIEEFKIFVPNATYEAEEQDQNEMCDKVPEGTPDENLLSPSDVDPPKYTAVTDPSIAAVYKYGSYEEHLFFDQLRESIGYKEVFDNFLKCLLLYNHDVITRTELITLATSFLGQFPDLLRQFKDMLGFNESGDNIELIPMRIINLENERRKPEVGLDVDFSAGGRNGASYRALPNDFKQPKCSGRTALCKEVLNDTWVSFPSWSEDSTFVTSCKTQFEEIMYRCEDERFEIDMALQANIYTMQTLEAIQKRISKMNAEERAMFSLDETLGGTSAVLHQKALHRLYGDKTYELVEGLKRNPVVAVPIILKRLKAKEEEWREKEEKYKEIWRTQMDHYYLKSLDHQGINFKQNDSKSFRPKSLLNEMEMAYAEKKENKMFNSTAHFVLEFKEMDVFQDAINLMLQYLKKLPGVYRDDRCRIEMLVRSFIPDFFGAPRQTIMEVDLEEEEEVKERDEPMEVENDAEERSGHTSPTGSNRDEGSSDQDESNSNEENELSDETDKAFIEESDVFDKIDPVPVTNLPYTLFFVSKTWYVFFRQFHILCERLSRLLYESNKQEIPIIREEQIENKEDVPEKKFRPSYTELIEKLSLLLSGSMDFAQFEEEARSLFGIHAFVSFTMDKLILNIVRQLQQVVTDDVCKQSTAFFLQHIKMISSGGYTSPLESSRVEYGYLRKVEKMMEDERCFKIVWHKKDHTLTIQLIEQESEDIPDPCEAEKWSDYLDAYITEDSCSEDILSETSCSPVILPRNLRKQMLYWKNKVIQLEKLWQARENAKFLKKNLPISSRKRKALSLISPLLRKMSRRSSVQEEIVQSTCSAETSNEGAEPNQADITVKAQEPSREPECEKNVDDTSSDIKIVPIDENSKEAQFVLVDLAAESTSLQEESVHTMEEPSDLQVEEVHIESTEPELDIRNQVSVESPTSEPEQMDLDDNSCNSALSTGKKSSLGTSSHCEENLVQGKIGDSSSFTDNAFENIGAEMDLTSRIDLAVEAASQVIETIGVEDSKEGKNVITDSDPPENEDGNQSDSKPEDSPVKIQSGSVRRKILRKSCDYSIRTRRNRTNQTYVKRRIKRGIVKTLTSSKGKKRRQAKAKSEFLDDPSFDYTYFSELSESDKSQYLALKYVTIDDDVEGCFRRGSYKIYFVQNCDLYIFRKDSLTRANEVHQAISEIKTSNFNAWHRVWLDRYVTPVMAKCCNDWLLKSDAEKFKVVRLTVGDGTRTPYIPYYKYKIRYYKIEP